MHHYAPALLVGLLSLALPSLSEAEMQIELTVNGVSQNDTDDIRKNGAAFLLSEQDLNEDVIVKFHITGIDAAKNWLDFWEGDSCNTVEKRTSSGGATPCTHLAIGKEISGTEADVEARVSVLFAAAEEGLQHFFVVAVDGTESAGEVTNFDSVDLQLDLTAPAQPDGLEGAAGDTRITVEWDANNEGDLHRYLVYTEPTASENCAEDATRLVPGETPAAGDSQSTVTPPEHEKGFSGDDLGLEYNEWAAVGVAAVDKAGNVSPLSELACIQRVQTMGFCEILAAEGGETQCEDCSVSRVGTGRSSSLPAWLFAALGAAFIARRRRP